MAAAAPADARSLAADFDLSRLPPAFYEDPFPAIPDVPTAAEAFGLRSFEAYAWQGLTAPARTPDEFCTRRTAELAAVLADPAVQGRMRGIGPDPLSGGPEEHRRLIASERALYWPLIRELGIALD